MINRIVCGLLAQERNLERTAPRRRDQRRDVRVGLLEQVAQPDVGEAPLGLHRSRRNHQQASLACGCDRREPERRLPDPRLALDHESGWPFDGTVEEGRQQAELRPAPDDVAHWHTAIVTVRSAEVSSRIGQV